MELDSSAMAMGNHRERGMLFMWNYEKRLQYPIKITTPNAKIATFIMSQYGGPDGEIGASMRYLSQRFTMSDRRVCGLLTDIGTEEPVHGRWTLCKKPVFTGFLAT